MRLAFFFLIVACLKVNANGFAQRVSIHAVNTSIEKVFYEIKKQTGYLFLYDEALIKKARKVNVRVKDGPLETVLKECFAGQPLTYQIFNKTIIVKSKANAPLPVHNAEMDSADPAPPPPDHIRGMITDASGNPLAGATITVKGTRSATQTGADGRFVIETGREAVLVISFVGYDSREITAAEALSKGDALRIVLTQSEGKMDELVVIGYGTARKRDVTGAVSRADLKAFKESPNVNVLQSLQGSVAGLNVGAVNKAGTSPSVSIRGRVSISGTNSPLVVLDGIIYRGDLSDINPADIASVDILKDASAAAIYGSQASNGVLLITTRTGTGGKRPTISLNTTLAFQKISNNDMLPLDSRGYLRLREHRYLEQSRTGDDLLDPNPGWDVLKVVPAEVADGIQKGVNTNWWDMLTNKTPLLQNHDISISGRTEQSSYYFSLGYTNQENVVINDTYKRYSFRLNLESKLASWFKLGMQSAYSVNDYSGVSPSLSNLILLAPQLAYRDSTGALIKQPNRAALNPLLEITQDNFDKRNNLFALVYADLDIPFVEGLNYRLNFGNNYIQGRDYNFNPFGQNFTGTASKANNARYNQTLDHIFSYKRAFGPHDLNATFVYGYEINKFEATTANATGFDNPSLGYNGLEFGKAELQRVSSEAWKETSLYQMYRLIYGFKGRYVFTGTLRNDGFSGFAPGNKVATFPSAAFAWNLREEGFLRDKLSSLDELKVRVSYGANGNRTVGRYQTLSTLTASFQNGYLFGDGGAAQQGQNITRLANRDLRWETTKTLNFGIDFSLWNRRLSGELNLYNANTTDLLYTVNIPAVNGLTSIPMNIGKLNNKGIELVLNGDPIRRQNFTWSGSVNFSLNRNKVESILGIDANGDGREDDLIASKIFIGEPFGVAYDYHIIGMWQLADYRAGIIPAGFTYGTYKVEDVNGDNAYSAAADRKILGYTDPSYRISLLNTWRYRHFELKAFINSIQGGKKYYYGQPGASLPNPDNMQTNNFFDFDYWTPENPDARYRQIGFYTTAVGETFSPYIQRSFIRLQDVTLSYDLPQAFANRIALKRARVFLNGKNLFTITDWDGWDPETGTGLDVSAYPLMKSYSIGLSIDL
ncbi:SusC/RagA family TonB-linked outer membrane protein [Niabella aurantiaca]|uniref:SusC/RagA family TonB-linked outer membrane protein n=1 Tax=Niabella aurantiaca TaxID=379900 RepID=UPI00035FC7B2|nr:SusC/RagA family TonB-linked outer membrane protein [Niabella aurantiaca]